MPRSRKSIDRPQTGSSPAPSDGSSIDPVEQQIQKIVAAFERKLREQIRGAPGTLAEIEEESQGIGEATKEIIERERLDAKGTGYEGAYARCPECGNPGRYRGCYQRCILTRTAERRIRRAYYYCDRCHRGFCPLDAALGGLAGAFSLGVWSLVTRFSSYVPYAQAVRELAEVCGIPISQSSIQRIARASGAQLQKEWERAEECLRKDPEPMDLGQPLLWLRGNKEPLRTTQLQSAMDGLYLFIDGEWREVKLAVSFHPEGKALGCNYSAARLESHQFGPRAWVLHQMSGGYRCSNTAVTGDGAPWVWKEYGKYLPRSVQILDYWHVSEYVAQIARLRFGGKTDQQMRRGRQWAKTQEEHLLQGRADKFIASLRRWRPTTQEASELRRTQLAYYTEHRSRLRYADYRIAGWQIGSSTVESGNNHVIQQRMKRPGMRWSGAGAQAMLHLRASVCSTDRPSYIDLARRTMKATLT